MSSKRINIFSNVSIHISEDMELMLNAVSQAREFKLNLADDQQKKLLKELFERNLLVRRRKNNEVSYSIRPGISWT